MTNLDMLVNEPRYLPHRVDLAGDRVSFVDTTRARLAAASFLAGPTPPTDVAPIACR